MINHNGYNGYNAYNGHNGYNVMNVMNVITITSISGSNKNTETPPMLCGGLNALYRAEMVQRTNNPINKQAILSAQASLKHEQNTRKVKQSVALTRIDWRAM